MSSYKSDHHAKTGDNHPTMQVFFIQDSLVSDSPSDITLSHVGLAEQVSAQPRCHLTKAIITRQLSTSVQQCRSPSRKILSSQIRLLISHCHTLAVLNRCTLSPGVILQKPSSHDNYTSRSILPIASAGSTGYAAVNIASACPKPEPLRPPPVSVSATLLPGCPSQAAISLAETYWHGMHGVRSLAARR